MAALDAGPGSGAPEGAVRNALIWNVANFFITQLASAAIFFILARQLDPAVFGVFALALVAVDVVATQGKSAAVDALLQRRDFRQETMSTAFFWLMAQCLLVVLIAVLAAPALADAFKAESLEYVLPALAATLVFAPFLAIMEAQAMRDLQFRQLALRNMASVLFGGAAGLAVVFSQYAEWALVAQRLVHVAAGFFFLLIHTKWLPSLRWHQHTIAWFARTQGALWATQGLAVSLMRVPELIVGARLGMTDLGIMRVCGKFVEILHGSLTNSIMPLWVPMLTRLRSGKEAQGQFFRHVIAVASLICLPAFVGVALVGPDLAALLLPEKYADAGRIISFLALGGLFIPIVHFRGPILVGMQRIRPNFVITAIDLALTAITFWALAPYGLAIAVLGGLIPTVVIGVISVVSVSRAVEVPILSYLRAIAPAYLAVAAMSVAVLALRWRLDGVDPLLLLTASAALGGAVYATWIGLFHRRWALEAWRTVRHR
jgi:O-antigen/teichoic acid export membrane protein